MLRFRLRQLLCWGAQAPPREKPSHFVLIGITGVEEPQSKIIDGKILTVEEPVTLPIMAVVKDVRQLFRDEFSEAAAVLCWLPTTLTAEDCEDSAAAIEERFVACASALTAELGSSRVYAVVSPRTANPDAEQLRDLAHQVLVLVQAGVPEAHLIHGAAELWDFTSLNGNSSHIPGKRGAVG